jgi:hypothetical protein
MQVSRIAGAERYVRAASRLDLRTLGSSFVSLIDSCDLLVGGQAPTQRLIVSLGARESGGVARNDSAGLPSRARTYSGGRARIPFVENLTALCRLPTGRPTLGEIDRSPAPSPPEFKTRDDYPRESGKLPLKC